MKQLLLVPFLLSITFSNELIANSKSLSFEQQIINESLSYPWSVAELPNGDLLITEKRGTLKRIKLNGEVESITGLPEVYFKGQGGLLDIIIADNFEETNQVFISYAWGTDEANTLRVMRAVLSGNELTDRKVLIDTEPYRDTPVHYGARMAFLADGTLAITTGDGFDYRERAQKLGGLMGKTIRITRDGNIPIDNPFVNEQGKRSEIYSYGHRNPQGLAFDERRNVLWQHEHGPAGGDEINKIEAGNNYGWPVVTKGKDYSGATISPFTEYEGMEQPLFGWTPSIAPSGLAVYYGDEFPQLEGKLLVGALVDRTLYAVDPDTLEQTNITPKLNKRIRDVFVTQSGKILLLTDSDSAELIQLSGKKLNTAE